MGSPTSWASSPAVRRSMQANKRRDTKPELRIRSELFRLGLRFRVDRRPDAAIVGRADVVFTRRRVAVFVDGCYWHGCPVHYVAPSTNAVYWSAKVDGNRRRDASTTAALAAAGWTVVRIWEHEEPSEAAAAIALVVRGGWDASAGDRERGARRRAPGAGLGQTSPACLPSSAVSVPPSAGPPRRWDRRAPRG